MMLGEVCAVAVQSSCQALRHVDVFSVTDLILAVEGFTVARRPTRSAGNLD